MNTIRCLGSIFLILIVISCHVFPLVESRSFQVVLVDNHRAWIRDMAIFGNWLHIYGEIINTGDTILGTVYVTATLYDSEGNILNPNPSITTGTLHQSIKPFLPNTKSPFEIIIINQRMVENYHHYSISLEVDPDLWTNELYLDDSAFEKLQVRIHNETMVDDELEVIGTIKNLGEKTIEDSEVNVISYNSDGLVAGEEVDYIYADIEPGSEVPFNVKLWIGNVSSDFRTDSYLIYAQGREEILEGDYYYSKAIIVGSSALKDVTFDTVPANLGKIIFSDENYCCGATVPLATGVYELTANVSTGAVFDRWETIGDISVADPNSISTDCTVLGSGTLRMIQSVVCTITFETSPINVGTITFDGIDYSHGDRVSKNSGTYSMVAHPLGYGFGGWETIGSISISDLNSVSTTVTISANGTLRMIQAGSPTPTVTNPPPQSGCVIVTASHGSETASEVVFMRHVRDDMIGSNEFGRTLVAGWNTFYYSWSPIVAGSISNSETLQTGAKIALLPLVGIVNLTAFLYTIIAPISTTWASIIGFSIGLLLGITTYFVMPVLLVSLFYKKRYLIKQKLSKASYSD